MAWVSYARFHLHITHEVVWVYRYLELPSAKRHSIYQQGHLFLQMDFTILYCGPC